MTTPRMWLVMEHSRRKMTTSYPEADHAVVEGRCPFCDTAPFKVQGGGRRASADDRAWEATGFCSACAKRVGTLRVEAGTLFGVTEDERVLRGMARVY